MWWCVWSGNCMVSRFFFSPYNVQCGFVCNLQIWYSKNWCVIFIFEKKCVGHVVTSIMWGGDLPGTVDLPLEFIWWSFPNSSANLLLWYLVDVWKAPEAHQSSCFSMEFIRRLGFPSTFWACPTCWSATAGSEFFHLETEWWFELVLFSSIFQIVQA